MTTLTEIKIPSIGEGIIEATIIRWLVNEGTVVKADDPLVEIATDKVDSEIFAPVGGKLRKIIRKEGDIARVGETIALIQPEGVEKTQEENEILQNQFTEGVQPEPGPEEKEVSEIFTYTRAVGTGTEPGTPERFGPGHYLSPFVRKIVQELGIGIESLIQIKGTGNHGRITREDLYAFLKERQQIDIAGDFVQNAADHSYDPQEKKQQSESLEYDQNIEIIPMDRVRKIIAKNMTRSKFTAPHVTSFYEADLTSLVEWRESCKYDFQQKYGVPLTFTSLFVEAVAKVLEQFPQINVSVAGENIIRKKNIHIGVATALPDGNLIVPVIHNANKMNLAGIAVTLNDLVTRARQGTLLPEEISGGTFTITNLGMVESLTGTPIINQPESAILAIGSIRRKPAVVIWNQNESIGIRSLCILSLSYDHRIIDGVLGGRFLREVAKALEEASPVRPF